MKIVIATPLYPPDIAQPAPYVKTLAGKLSDEHSVTVALYGRLPEEVAGVTFACVDKRAAAPIRMWKFFWVLWRTTKDANILYALNGPSVELVATIVSFLRGTPMLLHLGDQDANEWVAQKPLLRFIKWIATKRACHLVESLPPQRPEILPLSATRPDFTAYEAAWQEHSKNLLSSCVVVVK